MLNAFRRNLPISISLLAIPLLLYAALLAFAYFGQERLVYFPGIGRDNPATPAALGLAYQNLTLKTADGERLHAWFVPHEKPRGTMILSHGNAGSIADRLPYLPMFRRLGLATLSFDYRGYGQSTGKPSEEGLTRDAEAAWNYVVAERGVPANRIVLFGESLGGAVAAQLAARLSAQASASERPALLVLASVFTSVPDLGGELYRWLPVRWLARIRHDTRAALAGVTCPVLVAHSPDDDIVPWRHGRALFEAAPGPKAFLQLAGGHNEGFVFRRPDWVAFLGAFIDRHLGMMPEDS